MTELSIKDFEAALAEQDGAFIFSFLERLDNSEPSRAEAKALKLALEAVKEPVLAFQIKKSLRLAAFKLKKTQFKVTFNGLEKLLSDSSRLDDLALGIAGVEAAEAFLACDLFRNAGWQSMPAPILVSFCYFFKKHGNISDETALIELTRHKNANVITAALTALEKIDPDNLQSIIIPLLNSPQNEVKKQAIQAFRRWNRSEAIKYTAKLINSGVNSDILIGLYCAKFFLYPEVEPYLIRLLSINSDENIFNKLKDLFAKNARPDLPFKLAWPARTYKGRHKEQFDSIINAVIEALIQTKQISEGFNEFSDSLNKQIEQKEQHLVGIVANSGSEEPSSDALPSLNGAANDYSALEKSSEEAESVNSADEQFLGSADDGAEEAAKNKEIDTAKNTEKIGAANKAKNAKARGENEEPAKTNAVDEAIKAKASSAAEEANECDKAKEFQAKTEADAKSASVSKVEAKPAEKADIKIYDSLAMRQKIQVLARLTKQEFTEYKHFLEEKLNAVQGKELASLIVAFGKYASANFSDTVKKFLKSDDPDIICACIKALASLDPEYLCLYIPQYLQDKNGKIRMTAARIFVQIDKERIGSMISGLLGSSNTKQRRLGVSVALLLDFNLVRQALINALKAETTVELVEKIGMILAANPDRELLNQVYSISQTCHISLVNEHKLVVNELAQKLSVALNHTVSDKELLLDAKQAYEKEAAEKKDKIIKSASESSLNSIKNFNPVQTTGKPEQQSMQEDLPNDGKRNIYATINIVVWVAVVIAWGSLFGFLIIKYLFGG